MKLFSKSGPAPLVFGAAMLALAGTTASAEQVDAANQELDAAGIKGAQLVPSGTLDELTAKADRVDTAEAATKGYTDALAAAGVADVAALVAQRDAYKVKADKFDKKPGAGHTNPVLPQGESDVEDTAPDANQQAIDNLPHNKALAGNPLFGPRIKD
ncbi:MAG: hypothetical protein ACRYFZ_19645 [Janthinobacterium lividum]